MAPKRSTSRLFLQLSRTIHSESPSRGGNHSTPIFPSIEENPPQLKSLKAKYGKDKLATLRDIYPYWDDEDLLSALHEANGNLEDAIYWIANEDEEEEGRTAASGERRIGTDWVDRVTLLKELYPTWSFTNLLSVLKAAGGDVEIVISVLTQSGEEKRGLISHENYEEGWAGDGAGALNTTATSNASISNASGSVNGRTRGPPIAEKPDIGSTKAFPVLGKQTPRAPSKAAKASWAQIAQAKTKTRQAPRLTPTEVKYDVVESEELPPTATPTNDTRSTAVNGWRLERTIAEETATGLATFYHPEVSPLVKPRG